VTAKEVYRLQEKLREASERLRELAYAETQAQKQGALVSSGDYMRSPEGRAYTKLEEEVKAAQDEIGGVVYRVPSANMPALREKLDKLIKKSRKLDAGTVAYYVDDEIEEIKSTIDPLVAMAELGYIPPRVQRFRYVVLSATPVKLAGWMLLATLTVEPGGVMVSKVPAFAYAWSQWREGDRAQQMPGGFTGRESDDPAIAAAHERLEAMNLGFYADEARATLCEHCGLARRRTKTHLVEHVETGEIKQVGSNCLRDFLGTDPHTIIKYAQYLKDMDAAMGDDEYARGSGGSIRDMISPEEYLTHVCTMLRTKGWIGASEEYKGTPTKSSALYNILNYGKTDKGRPLFEEINEEDHQRATAALDWALEHLGAKVHQSQDASDFDRNMYVAANGDTIPKKGLGILAYVPVAYARFQEREIERAQKDKQQAENPSEYVGKEKERLELTLKVTHIFENAGDWGTTWITVMRDENNNAFKWFGSYELERGATYVGKWTVKRHEEYKGTKQTVLNRPSGLKPVGTEEESADEFEADASTFVPHDYSHTSAGGHVYFPEGDPAGTFEVVGYVRGATAWLRPIAPERVERIKAERERDRQAARL
jgi:hypothetical protein